MSTTAAQRITTFLMFEGTAEEATLYTSLFDDAEVLAVSRYGPGEAGTEGTVQHATFSLAGQRFMCIDSTEKHEFGFSAKFGWLVGRYGVSWQLNLP
jgi:predicted 3-demethylubiquinone-9 3-methyltransferase (glyoxalase superfamily)